MRFGQAYNYIKRGFGENMKNICISTYCEWSSYGSVCQALALKQALLELGFNSFIIRDSPAPSNFNNLGFKFSKSPRVLARNTINSFYRKKNETRYKNSVKFIKENVDIIYYNDYEVLKKNPPKADFYIAGSDQIWHPALCKQSFFLDFLNFGQKRISYAASMGITDISQKNRGRFAELVNKMDSISVREEQMIPIIKQFTNKTIHRHIDPTFLVGSEYWRSLARDYPINKPYILVYAINWNRGFNKELKKLHKKTKLDIVALCPGGISSVWANKKIYDADPAQFLWLIDNAEAVVASSFHGVAISLNLNKKICAIVSSESPSRVSTLLNVLGVQKLKISDVMQFDLSHYIAINKKIADEKNAALEYLKEVLV